MAETRAKAKGGKVTQGRLIRKLHAIFEAVNHKIDKDLIALTDRLANLISENKISSAHHDYLKKLLAEKKGEKVSEETLTFLKNAEGVCHGITTLKLICKQLQQETPRLDPQGKPLPIDNDTWFTEQQNKIMSYDDHNLTAYLKQANEHVVKKSIETLATLDSHISLNNEALDLLKDIHSIGLDPEIDRFFSEIKKFQDPSELLSDSSQIKLQSSYADTHGRKMQVEYQVTAPVRTDNDFKTILKYIFPDGARANKLVWVRIPRHTMGMSAHNGEVDFYDSRSKKDLSFTLDQINYEEFYNAHKKVKGEDSTLYSFTVMDLVDQKTEAKNTLSYPDPDSVLRSLSFMSDLPSLDSKEQYNLLHMAAQNNDEKSLSFYLNLKTHTELGSQSTIDIHAKTKQGHTALDIAANLGSAACVEKLLEHKADVNLAWRNTISPFSIALAHGHAKVVEVLLKHGATFNPKKSFLEAIQKNHVEIINLLLNHRVNGQPVITGDMINLAFSKASKTGTPEVIKILLQHGAQVDKSTFFTLLKTANQPMLEVLLNHRGTDRSTLFSAIDYGDKKVVEILLKHRIGNMPALDVNAATKKGMTALFKAINADRTDLVKLLLRNGANITNTTQQINDAGELITYTSLDFARSEKMRHFLRDIYNATYIDAVKKEDKILMSKLLELRFNDRPIIENETINTAFSSTQSDDLRSFMLQTDAGTKVGVLHLSWLQTAVKDLPQTLQSEINAVMNSDASHSKKFFDVIVKLLHELDSKGVAVNSSSLGTFSKSAPQPIKDHSDVIYAILHQTQKQFLTVNIGLPKDRYAKPGLIEECPSQLRLLSPSISRTPYSKA